MNYFTIDSLTRVLNQNNFRIIHYETTLFSGKTIMVFAEKTNNNNPIFYKKEKNKYILEKKINFFIKFEEFKKKFNSFLIKNKKDFIVYGCGARSSNFVNFLNNSKKIKYFVDDNKEKQDLVVPGCNLLIKKFSKNNIKNKVILVGVNAENENIIFKKCLKLKVKRKDIFSILPPSKILIPFWKKMVDNF